MTASASSARATAATLLAVVLGLGGCRTPSAPPAVAPIEPLATRAAIVPSDGDLAAADLAMAVLTSDRVAGIRALARIDAYEESLEEEEAPSGLPGYGAWALAATLDDPVLFRQAMENLLDEDDLDPGLEELVEQYRDDDPLELARRRVRDARVRHLGTLFNHFAAPLGRSATTGTMALAGLVRSFFRAAVYEAERPVMDTTERQALGHWKRFLEENPDSEKTAEVLARIEENQRRWNQLQRDDAVAAAERALERDQPRVALVMAERALEYKPEDPKASRLRERAAAGVARWHAAREATERAPAWDDDLVPDGTHKLTVKLMRGDDPLPLLERMIEEEGHGPLADELRFIKANALGEHGDLAGMWAQLEAIAFADPYKWNMARHAEAAVLSTQQNPYRAFEVTRTKDRQNQAKWIFFGPLAQGPKDRNLPRPVEWLVDAPNFVEVVTSLPNRLLFYPWMQPWPFGRAPATFGRRYLERHPHGEHVDEVAEWLEGWEERRGNYVGALDAARLRSDVDLEDLRELDEKAARQKLEAADRERRADAQLSILKSVARDHPATEAGREAGRKARELAERLTPQHVRLSRGFLKEHPFLIGPDGIGLDPVYLDGDARNGELHPDGVAFVGGRTLELSFLAESGEEKDPAERRYVTVSQERMTRLVALLDETSLRLAQLERDYDHVSDADRDRFFETARLGVDAKPQLVAGARSEYAFKGMRETYGLVRSREALLPFDIVVQGSLYDFGFGVFPRIRMPKPTADAFLYR